MNPFSLILKVCLGLMLFCLGEYAQAQAGAEYAGSLGMSAALTHKLGQKLSGAADQNLSNLNLNSAPADESSAKPPVRNPSGDASQR